MKVRLLIIIILILAISCEQAKKAKDIESAVEESAEHSEEAIMNITKSIIYIDNLGQINQESIDEIGNGIPHLIIYNSAYYDVSVALSLDGNKWNNFLLDATSKNIYRCDDIHNMYLIINPTAESLIRAKIYRDKKYKIYYDYQSQIFKIIELL